MTEAITESNFVKVLERNILREKNVYIISVRTPK